MPLHSLTPLSHRAWLGLWHLTETPEQLWPLLPEAAHYAAALPPGRAADRARQWLAGRALAHKLLEQLTPEPATLCNDANGRPYFTQLPEVAVSLSHSGEWVAGLLAAHGQVGIDVETVRPKAQQLAARFLSEAEHASAGADPATYSLYWSAKETLYKLHSRRGLVLKEQILLDPFVLREAGVLTGHLLLENARSQHQLHYQRLSPEYVLTYCLSEMAR